MTLDDLINDPRTRAARNVYDEVKTGVCKVHKVARAGGTTSLAIESFLRGERVVIFTSTNNIIKRTIKNGIIDKCEAQGIKPPVIAHITSNFECVHNIMDRAHAESVIEEKNKEIKQLESTGCATEKAKTELKELEGKRNSLSALQVLPKDLECGFECQYFNMCTCLEVLREQPDIIVLTYAKVANMLRVIDETDTEGITISILHRLLSCRNVIFDESHEMEETKQKSIYADIEKSLNSGRYLPIIKSNDYPEFNNMLRLLYSVFNNIEIRNAIKQSRELAKADNYYELHNRFEVSRPAALTDKLDIIRKKDLVIFTAILSEIYQMAISGDAYKYGITGKELNAFLDY